MAESGSTDLSAAMQYQPLEALGCIAAAIYEVHSCFGAKNISTLHQTVHYKET